MTVVYIDLLFLLNLAANYLLLLMAGRMCGQILRRWLLAFSAVLGALYACVLFLPGLGWLSAAPCRMCMGVLMSLVAYGAGKGLFKVTLCFFGASAALGGMVLAAELLGGHSLSLEHGVLYSYVDIRLLLLLLILCYGLLSFLADRTFQHCCTELAPVSVQIGTVTVKLIALRDTGNTLSDPLTNRPVLVVDGACCKELLPLPVPLDRPVEAISALEKKGIGNWRLLPYRAVGVDRGLLLAVKADRVTMGKQDYGKLLVALSPTPVSDGGAYQALIGGNL